MVHSYQRGWTGSSTARRGRATQGLPWSIWSRVMRALAHGAGMHALPEQLQQAGWDGNAEERILRESGLSYALTEDLLKWNIWFRAEKNVWTSCYYDLKSTIWFKMAVLHKSYHLLNHFIKLHIIIELKIRLIINYVLFAICLFNVSWFLWNASLESVIKWDIGKGILHTPYWLTQEGWKGVYKEKRRDILANIQPKQLRALNPKHQL